MKPLSYQLISKLSRTAPVILMYVGFISGASLKPVEDIQLGISWANMRAPKWSNGALITVQYVDTNRPLIWLVTKSGHQSLSFSIPEVTSMLVYDWDRALDGTIAISGSAVDQDGRAGCFIAWLSPKDGSAKIVRTDLYRPAMIAAAPDGTIWTAGSQYSSLGEKFSGKKPVFLPEAAVIRHFSQSGKLLGSFVPQSTIKDPLTLSRSRNTLRASRDRVAWYSVEGRYVEISLEDRLLLDVPVELPGGQLFSPNLGFALTDAGDAYLSAATVTNSRGTAVEVVNVYALERSTQSWNPLLPQMTPSGRVVNDSAYIYGVDGRNLVLAGGRLVRFFRLGE